MDNYPKKVRDNLLFRAKILQSERDQLIAYEMCKRDILFFINVGLNVFEPRDAKMPHKPFITWDFQDGAILQMKESIEKGEDFIIEKSRDMGATWIVVTVICWFWMFTPGFESLLGSRKEDLVDNFQKDSLFGKFDYLIRSMPNWLKPKGWNAKKNRNFLKVKNPHNDNTIIGESSNKDFSVGGRYKVILLDEFALWNEDRSVWRGSADASPCRIAVSTPRGFGNQYADLVHGKDGIIIPKVRFHWSQHPTKSLGLYRGNKVNQTDKKKLYILDKEYKFPDDYEFILDGKLRSPWYDNECKRRSPLQIAQELDIDYLQSGTPVFRKDDLEIKGKYADPEPGVHYAIGVDPSEGSYDPATIVVLDEMGVEVAHVNGLFSIDILAEKVIQIGMKYNEALVAIENNSMGMAVIGKVKERYDNLYYQKTYGGSFDKDTETIGWRTTISSKPKLIQELEEAIREEFILLSTPETVDECLHYQYIQNPSTNRVSMGAAQGYHDDRVIATGIALQALKEIKKVYDPNVKYDDGDDYFRDSGLKYDPITGRRKNITKNYAQS